MLWITIDRSSPFSLTKQVYHQLKDKILKNELESGFRLPATRKLAVELGISRNIVIEVYEQLVAEGFLYTIRGSGTFVSEGLYFEQYKSTKRSSKQTKHENQDANNNLFIDFGIGVPDLKKFPAQKWGASLKSAMKGESTNHFNYIQPNGLHELRTVLSDFFLRLKGIHCNPDQIFITSGAMHGFPAISQILAPTVSKVVIEDPSYVDIRKVFSGAGYKIIPVPVDEKGLQVQLLPSRCTAGTIVVTPSHHFPLGVVLPAKRRIQLIEYARQHDLFIIENDYDSEFRFKGIPVSSLQMLDSDHVIHIGTFSEMLYPSVRLGYIIVPERLIDPCMDYFQATGHVVSSMVQLALLNFINNGELEKHVLRMKKLYKKKREFLIQCLKKAFPGITISGDAAGLYLVAEFKDIEFTDDLFGQIRQKNMGVYPVSEHASDKKSHRNKIILGYGNLDIPQIEEGIDHLKDSFSHYEDPERGKHQ